MQGLMLMFCMFVMVSMQSKLCPARAETELDLISQPLECFRKLYDTKRHDGHQLARLANERIAAYRRMLQDIQMDDVEHIRTTPVIRWAQSDSQIYLMFKLSHRQDSPTCSDIRQQSINTTFIEEIDSQLAILKVENIQGETQSKFEFRTECYFTAEKLMFSLNLVFEKPVKKLALRRQGLGSYTLIADKAETGIWAEPFTGSGKAAIWPDMREKFESAMDTYFQMVQRKSEKLSTKGKKKPKGKKSSSSTSESRNSVQNDLSLSDL